MKLTQISVLLLIIGLMGCYGNGARDNKLTASNALAGRWFTKAPMPTKHSEAAVVALNGKIYVIAGFTPAGSPANEEYDPVTDRWQTRASLPIAINHIGAAALNGKIYAIGGFTKRTRQALADAWEYNPTTDRWRPIAPLPSPRGAAGVAALGGRIHVVGGRDKSSVNTHEVYDPATNRWTELKPVPTRREHLGLAVFRGKLYAIGGRIDRLLLKPFSGGGSLIEWMRLHNIGVNEEYDPATNSWRSRAPLPTVRSGLATAVLGDRILVFGGERWLGVFNQTEAYDPVTDTWTELAPMPAPRHGISAAVIGSFVYIPGGGSPDGGTTALQVFTLK